MSNLDHLEMPAADLVTATAMLADLVCDLGSARGRLHEDTHAKALWIANRVRNDMAGFFETVLAEVEAASAAGRVGR
jgi:hypothetical protein